jgi:hypothetical protein
MSSSDNPLSRRELLKAGTSAVLCGSLQHFAVAEACAAIQDAKILYGVGGIFRMECAYLTDVAGSSAAKINRPSLMIASNCICLHSS